MKAFEFLKSALAPILLDDAGDAVQEGASSLGGSLGAPDLARVAREPEVDADGDDDADQEADRLERAQAESMSMMSDPRKKEREKEKDKEKNEENEATHGEKIGEGVVERKEGVKAASGVTSKEEEIDLPHGSPSLEGIRRRHGVATGSGPRTRRRRPKTKEDDADADAENEDSEAEESSKEADNGAEWIYGDDIENEEGGKDAEDDDDEESKDEDEEDEDDEDEEEEQVVEVAASPLGEGFMSKFWATISYATSPSSSTGVSPRFFSSSPSGTSSPSASSVPKIRKEVKIEGALTLDQLESMASSRRNSSHEFLLETKRTVIVRNLPDTITGTELIQSVPGAIRSVKFYPTIGSKDSQLKSALVEFNGDVPLARFSDLVRHADERIAVQPAKVCIRQALEFEVENQYTKSKANQASAEERLQETETERDELNSQLDTLQKALLALEKKLATTEADKEKLATKTASLKRENSILSDTLSQSKSDLVQIVQICSSVSTSGSTSLEGDAVGIHRPTTDDRNVKGKERMDAEEGVVITSDGESVWTGLSQPQHPMVGSLSKALGRIVDVQVQLEGEHMAKKHEKQQRKLQAELESKRTALVMTIFQHWRAWTRERILRREEELTRAFLEEEEANSKNPQYPCPICMTEYPIEEMYTLDKCYHRFCFTCLGHYLEVKIVEGQVVKIICPDPGCSEPLTPDEVRHCVSEELFNKYEQFALQAALNQIPDLRWCPKPGCGNAMIGEKEEPMMVCSNNECRYTFCFNCKEEWHADATCEQYQRWKKENSECEAKYLAWVKSHAKGCPKCGAMIEKNGGCNHMTCKNCTFEFCWLCLAQYSKEHFGRMPWTCRQFT